MPPSFPSDAIKKPAGASILRQACLETGHPLPGLVTATAAKIKMESRQADVALATAVTARAMTGIRNVMPVAAVPAVAAMTWRVVAAGAMTGTVPASMTRCVVIAGTMTRVVPAAVARTMTGVVPVAMTGGVTVSRLHSGRSEDGEAGSDCQESDELFHDALDFGLSRCRITAACKSDAAQMRLFSSTPFFHTFNL